MVQASLVQTGSETETTPLATPQNPLYANELPFNALSRPRGRYDRAQAFKYHEGNGYKNSQNDGQWKGLSQLETTPLATPQNPLYANELPFNALSRPRGKYDRA